ncbi:unnamed protein product [Caenorhabditis auriculariae]|uniref:EGF-like domain-containing protein n=1 Tax=Caenorhabditis auriculariae TaxID=2777116 RepID=A0A8S1H5E0_9PELO|nr:unnamed protein product [Caenorhabditis auriculariae]
MKAPGRCHQGDYDCGLGQCVPMGRFHDGKIDCYDGSDEWCFFGQISCGAYCADIQHTLPCVLYPKCDGTSKQLPWCNLSKEKLCSGKKSFPCKGYGECVLWDWLLDGKKDCMDGSDEDPNYVLPLEEGFRIFRKRENITLSPVQPLPPPADRQNLFVPGCSYCSSPAPKSSETTTPKYPFATLIPYPHPPKEIENEFFPPFPSTRTTAGQEGYPIGIGEFFPTKPTIETASPSATPPSYEVPTESSNEHHTQSPVDSYEEKTSSPVRIVPIAHTTKKPLFTSTTEIYSGFIPEITAVTTETTETETSEENGYEGNEHLVPFQPGGWVFPPLQPTTHAPSWTTNVPSLQTSTESFEEGFELVPPVEETTPAHEKTTTSTSTPDKPEITIPPPTQGFITTTSKSQQVNHENICLDKILSKAKQDGGDIFCKCDPGQFLNSQGVCEEDPALVTFKVEVGTVCGVENLSLQQKREIVHQQIKKKVPHDACVLEREDNEGVIVNAACESCQLSGLQSFLVPQQGENISMTTGALSTDICSNSLYNHCHRYAFCKPSEDNLRYSCVCRNGTEDVSKISGRQCNGVPFDEDCIMFFGICLIVWLLFLLGGILLSGLMCYLCCKICSCSRCKVARQDPAGLQKVIIGKPAARKTIGDFPNMKKIFGESLRNSAKGSTSVASAFALAELKKKNRVSRAPEMSNVVEVDSEVSSPMPDISPQGSPMKRSISKITLPSPTTAGESVNFENPTGNNSSSVSLVSAGEAAPQLPNLPLPLPVPITTAADVHKEDSVDQQVEPERPASSHSIGVQPTIWETFRVLGSQYSKDEERKSSVDSLEAMVEARIANHEPLMSAKTKENTARTETTATIPVPLKIIESPPRKAIEEPILSTLPEEPPATNATNDTSSIEEAKRQEKQALIADMLGVTLEASPPTAREKMTEDVQNLELEQIQTANPDTTVEVHPECFGVPDEKSLEAALLIEMAKRKIELALSPKTSEDEKPAFSVAFFKRLQAMRDDVDRPTTHGRRIIKKRRPVRTLSSISEKSAEIAAEAVLQDIPPDKSISCPPTTRSYLEWRPMTTARKNRLIEASGELSDVDIPKRALESDGFVSSPDIPDVTLRKSIENLHKKEKIAAISRTNIKTPGQRTKSVGNLAKKKAWDNTPFREGNKEFAWDTFLADISPRKPPRTAGNSPTQRRSTHRSHRSDSHFSMTSLPGRFLAQSPIFDPLEDSGKPPKEELWWGSRR